jgi:hypothetical protein
VELAMIEKFLVFSGTACIALVLTFFFCARNASWIVFFESSFVFVSVATGARVARYTAQNKFVSRVCQVVNTAR